MELALNSKRLRSDCPTNYFLELIGDKWSMLIIRDIVFWGKVQSGEFRQSDEHIATNILADRLASLTRNKIIRKMTDVNDRRREPYALTKKGLGLIPILLDTIAWSDEFGPDSLFTCTNLLEAMQLDREAVIHEISTLVQGGSFIFAESKWQPHRKNIYSSIEDK